MIVFGKTDRGMVRACNQDDFACGIFENGAAWAVVCDGMGGAAAGDIASKCAVETVRAIITDKYSDDLSEEQLKELFTDAAMSANEAILAKVKEDSSLSGMGTTLVIALAKDNLVCVAHAGDSRAYIIDNEAALQLTKDHSVVQELVDLGRITPQEALVHPNRNIITRALGVGRDLSIDFGTHKFDSGCVLLCSDGLSNCVGDARLAELAKLHSPDELPDIYISEANSNGGYDNITAVIICK